MILNLIDRAFEHTPTKQICHYHRSDKLTWDRSISQDGPVVVTDSMVDALTGQDKIALLLEPRELVPGPYDYIKANSDDFKYILSHDEYILDLPNAVRYEFGGCWIEPEDVGIHTKSKPVSIIASSKNMTSGHRLRHIAIAQFKDRMDVYGRGYNPVEKKVDALREYYFSVAIENSSRDYYFTEKLIDCFATGTIPIYWGMPSIGKYFNKDGIITFNSIRELSQWLDCIHDEEMYIRMYEERKEAVLDNFNRCKKYFATEDSIYEAITRRGL